MFDQIRFFVDMFVSTLSTVLPHFQWHGYNSMLLNLLLYQHAVESEVMWYLVACMFVSLSVYLCVCFVFYLPVCVLVCTFVCQCVCLYLHLTL